MPDLSLAAIIGRPPKYSRSLPSRGLYRGADDPPVDRTGGERSAGLIRGVSVITRGEALGHREWIDHTMLEQVAGAINAAGDRGIKARFTHPGLSSDGLGTLLGRVRNASVQGEQVIADLHFSPSAHDTPDGDLADYVMSLAEQDPDQFGTSIVFTPDIRAEREFEVAHSVDDGDGGIVFRSPDPDNEHNFVHARLRQLHAVDTVDEPAANPAGLFCAHQDLAAAADGLLSYILMGGERPALDGLPVDPDRVSATVHRFLGRHGLTITHRKEPHMADTPTAAETGAPAVQRNLSQPSTAPPAPSASGTPPAAAPVTLTAGELRAWSEEFGASQAVAWLGEGIDLPTARQRFNAALREQLAASQQQIEQLQQRLQQAKTGHEQPLSLGVDDSGAKQPAKSAPRDNYEALTAAIAAKMPAARGA